MVRVKIPGPREPTSLRARLPAVTSPPPRPLVLLTGASGYVGGRLLPRLLEAGWRVRCLARRPEELRTRVPHGVEVVGGDLAQPDTLPAALAGARAAFYLAHSLGETRGFEDREIACARNFALAAVGAGLARIVYLGGLGDDAARLSPHLRTRHEVGRILRESGVLTVELRAGAILGAGSLSFELARALVERLPVLVTPRWTSVPTQPIAIDDVLRYLVASLELPLGGSTVFEIGGADVMTYRGLMREIARQRKLSRLFVPVPLLSPRLSSLWLGLVTPVYARVGRKLVESMRHPMVVRDASARRLFGFRPKGVSDALAAAFEAEDREVALSRWSDALSSGGEPRDWGGVRLGSRLVDARSEEVPVPAEFAFAPIRRIGGRTGWYANDWLWDLRGFLDLLAGGVGMRRGRRDPEELHPGDPLDCWRVEAYERGKRLLLRAEMKVPGRAWLELKVEKKGQAASIIRQTAIFEPHGLTGLAYWYVLWPLHQLVFQGMLEGLGVAARAAFRGPRKPAT